MEPGEIIFIVTARALETKMGKNGGGQVMQKNSANSSIICNTYLQFF